MLGVKSGSRQVRGPLVIVWKQNRTLKDYFKYIYLPSEHIAAAPWECIRMLLPEHVTYATTGDDF